MTEHLVKTVDMSGFEEMGDKIGYGYEAVCQRALWEGIKYLTKCDRPEDILKGTAGFKNVYGICETPESAKELETVWSKLDKEVFHGWTGAQHQVVVGHLQYISKNGIEKWIAEFKNEPDRIFDIDLTKLMSVETCSGLRVKSINTTKNINGENE